MQTVLMKIQENRPKIAKIQEIQDRNYANSNLYKSVYRKKFIYIKNRVETQ